jgi:hypothetical protein
MMNPVINTVRNSPSLVNGIAAYEAESDGQLDRIVWTTPTTAMWGKKRERERRGMIGT